MNVPHLIDYLESIGFVFFLENEKIKLRSPDSSLTPEISMELKNAKDYILNLLKNRQKNKFLPLSYGQRALLFEYQFAPDSPAYNVVLSAKIDNKVDLKVFEATFKSLIKKHPMLRTTYGFLDGVPYQDIHADIKFHLTVDEVFDWPEEKIEQWSLTEADKPFNLYKGPLLKVCLLRNVRDGLESELYFLFCVHHIALDLWSLNLILQDVADLYQKHSQNIAINYDSNVEYLNYIDWQRNTLVENEAKLKNFWGSKLKGQIDFSGFPPSKRHPVTRTFQGEFYSSKLPSQLLKNINEFAKIKGVTPYMVSLSALFVFIAKLTGNKKVSILTPAAGRNCPNSERTVGYFVNPIPLIAELDNNPSFSDLCIDVRTLVLDSLEHQDFPMSRIVKLIKTKNSSDPFSLFQTLFLWDQEQVDKSFDISMNGISLFKEKLITEQRGAAFNLQIAAISINKTLHISWRYAIDLYDRETIISFAKRFEKLIESLLLNIDAPVLSHCLLDPTEPEFHQAISEWNQTDKSYSENQTIAQLFEKQVERTPEAVALVFEGESLTYGEVNRRANQLARFIRKKYHEQTSAELKPDTLIALCAYRSIEMIIAILAILKAGGAYVPIDPSCPSERIRYILEDSKAPLVLTEPSLAGLFKTDSFLLLNNEAISHEAGAAFVSPCCSQNLSYVFYTSGTSGKPKGVMIEHKSVVNVVTEMLKVYQLNEADNRVAAYSSYSFDVSVTEFFATLFQGGVLHLLSERTRTDIRLLSEYIKNNEINFIFLPPAILSILPDENYVSLRGIIFAGERCDQKVGEYWANRYPLFNYYGPTETSVYATGRRVSPENVNLIGKPIMNTCTYVCDANSQPMPIGIAGELCIGGAGLARGYLNQPELTQERFVSNPFATEEDKAKGYTRLYKTGDLVRWLPDGNLEYLGRNDFQIKLRGNRIELSEIENVLGQHPEIQQNVVVAQTEQGQHHIIAYYVATTVLSETQLALFLSRYLPDYMIPSFYIPLESLPLTSNGKVDRAALPEAVLVTDIDYVTPRNELERQLCEIWKDLLKVEKIGIHDDFFQRGGNSILAIQTVHCIGQQVNREVSISELFQYKTVARLSEVLSSRETQVLKIETQSSPQVRLSFAQERLWFIEQYEGGTSAYHIPALLNLEKEFDCETLKKSIQAIVERHEVLRSIIVQDDLGIAYQRVLNDPLSIGEEWVSEQELLNQCEEMIHKPFDLYVKYPLRVVFYHTEISHYVLLVVHHVAFDGWSIEVFMKELQAYYDSFSEQSPSALPMDLPIQYKDFAVWQRSYLSGPELTRQQSYWKAQLANYQSLTLLTDKTRPTQISYQGADQVFNIDKNLSQQLRNLAKEQGVSLYTVLLTGFYLLLREYAQQDDLIIGTPAANRHYPGTENMIGFFVNSMVLRIQLDEERTVESTIQQVYELLHQAQGHQDIPFEKLVDYLEVVHDPSRHPLFQVMFGVQNFKLPLTRFKLLPLNDRYQIAKFDISLFIDDSAESLEGCLNYATNLFEGQTMERIIGHYSNILTMITRHPKKLIKEISCLSSEEKKKIIFDRNQTEKEYPSDRTIGQLFEEQVKRTPDAIALVYEEERLTYREVNQRANQLARFIRKKYQEETSAELKPDTLIALCLHRSVEMIVGILGVLKSGGAYVPIDPHLPSDRIDHILNDTKASLLLTERTLLSLFQNHVNSLQIIALDEQGYLEKKTGNLPPQGGCHSLAYVIYTSGTTGNPKGVMIEHQAIVNALHLIRNVYRIDSTTKRVAAYTNFVFDMSVAEIFTPLLQGGELHLLSEPKRSDMGKLSEYLQDRQIQHVFLPPAILTILPKLHYPHLQHVMIGGESCNQAVEFWATQHTLFNYYGPTEGTIYATGTVAQVKNMNIIGSLLDNTKGYVLNKHFQPVPVGVSGELYLGGAGLARGYLNQPELTLERFIDNPFATEEDKAKGYNRLYKTGDLVRWLPSGNLEYLGRNDSQIKLRGYRIELGEIENVLSHHPEIQQNVVLLRALEGEPCLVAYYVSKSVISQAELVQFLSGYLPDYMRPSYYIPLESFPLTTNSKLDRVALPDPSPSMETVPVEPRNELEEQLCEIWKEVLKVEKIGINDDFFSWGGNSILAIQAIYRIKQRVSREVTIAELFQYKTVARLSEMLIAKILHADEILDLNNELFGKTIVLNSEKKGNFTLPKNILLTGATGYVGAFLLHDLLAETNSTIYCLIRAKNVSDAKRKLYDNLRKYQIKVEDRSRLVPVVGDLEMDNLGIEKERYEELSSSIDVVYHNGAYVHHLLPYKALHAANVKGTFEIIKFASLNRVKFIHFISTVGVLPKSENQIFNEETSIENIPHVETHGYVASKWVAENMIMRAKAAGVPAHIYRLGRAAASLKTGVCNLDDFFYRLLVSCVKMGYYPDISFNFDVTPVDLISKRIVKIAKSDQSSNGVFHIISQQPTSLDSIFHHAPVENVKSIPLALWCQKVRNFISDDQPLPISPYLFQFDQHADSDLSDLTESNELDHISHSKTMNYLKSIGENYILDIERYYPKNFAYIEAAFRIGVLDEK